VKIPSNILTLVLGILITLISLWYGQNHGLLPVAASEDAKEIDDIFNIMMTIATGLFLIVEGVLVYSIIKFRRRKGDQTDGPAVEGNVPLEIFWTAIPTIIVFFLAIYSFEIYNNIGGLDPDVSANSKGSSTTQVAQMAMAPGHQHISLGIGPDYAKEGLNPLIVKVKAIQYAWIFTYPETGIVSGELHVPSGRPVSLEMEAGDVLHAFWVPQLRLKQDVIPGRNTTLAFTANREGQYPVICAELCGAYHGGMKSSFIVHSQNDYDKWVQDNTIASTPQTEPVALSTQGMTDTQYLAPYMEEMGITTSAIDHLHHNHL
jgi:cytochrome c oxidase subunit 2